MPSWKTTLIASAVILAGASVFELAYVRQVHAQARHDAFTMEVVTTTYDEKAGGLETLEDRTIARRADGSEAWEVRYPQHPEWGIFSRVEMADGRAMTVWHSAQMVMTGKRTPAQLASRLDVLRNHPDNCAFGGEKVIGEKTIEGIPTYVIGPSRVGTQAVLIKEARAPSLGCQALSDDTAKRIAGGEYAADTQTRIVPGSLKLGEPEARFFTVPANYTEGRPSEARQKYEEILHTGACAQCAASDAKVDQRYAEAHARLTAK